jgi:hypothetical protein
LLRTPIVVDLRNIYRPAEMAAAGFHYTSVGRPNIGVPHDDAALRLGDNVAVEAAPEARL